ncbi:MULTISPECIES: hypothetical protein [Methanohalophilus]|uniref:Uncharacterized protein n=1 Tax=Methanohalophilus euhalobius TaxID=51203 RepID=A0A285G797_9EURY|nr:MULTISPECIES: hypothetical protein [Methanohalophilus]RSD33793.1 MAG: hypothetical protein CI953_1329 [Methanohalophilus sp.]OBZ35566.1 MAG: hypothetical protein A9957_00405 [Methanohalophilus sp. DAL1]ODV49296.1 MAG: hypothetical protein A8273_1443 [Methanohalophilus sp. 2-GBenrich]PQV41941.1 hypothetical protein B0H22_11310 [Methanohalophilus euhalobius]RNI12345.1 hypothetical protein EDD83_01980 [Methanohalophilus euhalobius]
MSCIFCGKECMDYEIEGGSEKDAESGKIIGKVHVCLDCIEELRDVLGVTSLERDVSSVEYEILEETIR